MEQKHGWHDAVQPGLRICRPGEPLHARCPPALLPPPTTHPHAAAPIHSQIPKAFELVGLTYSGWFTYRYLLFKSSREELIKVSILEAGRLRLAGFLRRSGDLCQWAAAQAWIAVLKLWLCSE
jgi:hypothetical protein